MERIQELDILKAFAIIMVLIGHANCPQYLYHVVYLVHVPLFFMVSGCTSRDDESYYNANNVKQFIKKKSQNSIYSVFKILNTYCFTT